MVPGVSFSPHVLADAHSTAESTPALTLMGLSDIKHSCAEIFQQVYSKRSQVTGDLLKAGNWNCESFDSYL